MTGRPQRLSRHTNKRTISYSPLLCRRAVLRYLAPCSWTPEESKVECCEHQDNANIHCQSFPESVPEEHEIYSDYDGCHRHHVKYTSYLSAHSLPYQLNLFLFHAGPAWINGARAFSRMAIAWDLGSSKFTGVS